MMYLYYADIDRIYDGDSITVTIDLGFHAAIRERSMRIMGVDTPELRGESDLHEEAGRAVRDLLRTTVLPTHKLIVESKELDKYGRILGNLYISTEMMVAGQEFGLREYLIAMGLAVPYDGGTKHKWSEDELKIVIANCERIQEDYPNMDCTRLSYWTQRKYEEHGLT